MRVKGTCEGGGVRVGVPYVGLGPTVTPTGRVVVRFWEGEGV